MRCTSSPIWVTCSYCSLPDWAVSSIPVLIAHPAISSTMPYKNILNTRKNAEYFAPSPAMAGKPNNTYSLQIYLSVTPRIQDIKICRSSTLSSYWLRAYLRTERELSLPCGGVYFLAKREKRLLSMNENSKYQTHTIISDYGELDSSNLD